MTALRWKPVALLLVSTVGLVARAEEKQEDPLSFLDLALRERADALASRAVEFRLAGEFIAAADLYREAIEMLPVVRRNGSRFHAYRESYAEAIKRQNLIESASLPGVQFSGRESAGFDPSRFVTTIIPKLEVNDKPLNECLDWLRAEFNRLNPDADELVIHLDQDVVFRSSGVWLRLSNVTFQEALRYTVSLQQMQVKMGDSELIIGPMTSHSSDLPTAEFVIDPRILTADFGNLKDLVAEAGIKLRPFENIIRIPKQGIAFAKARTDSMTEIALWIRLIDRI